MKIPRFPGYLLMWCLFLLKFLKLQNFLKTFPRNKFSKNKIVHATICFHFQGVSALPKSKNFIAALNVNHTALDLQLLVKVISGSLEEKNNL